MNIPFALRLLTFGLAALIIISSATAFAAANTTPATNVGYQTVNVSINNLKPSTCTGLFLTNLVTGAGTLTGTEGNDLILGSPDIDVIDGLGGDDCILGGGGDDQVTGGDGTDICIGGPGTDTFINCEGESQ
jgi:Ca2+-binding RTX toxin-like protein